MPLQWLTNLQDWVIPITLGIMELLLLSVWTLTGNYKAGLVAMEIPNLWNLTILITRWATPELKPFLPLHLSVLLLVIPLGYLIFAHFFLPIKD